MPRRNKYKNKAAQTEEGESKNVQLRGSDEQKSSEGNQPRRLQQEEVRAPKKHESSQGQHSHQPNWRHSPQGQKMHPQKECSKSPQDPSSKPHIVRGEEGISGWVETNYLRLNLEQMPSVAYQYDVTITPDRPKKFFHQAFTNFNQTHYTNIIMAFDGKKNCYTIERLPFEGDREVIISDESGRILTFVITIKATRNTEIDLGSLRTYPNDRIFDKPMRALQCLEIVLSNPCQMNGVRAGPLNYSPLYTADERADDGYQLWTGLFQAMKLGDEPYLNVDITHKYFSKEMTILDWLKANIPRFDGTKKQPKWVYVNLLSFLKGLRIIYERTGVLPKEYTFNDVSRETASQHTFLHEASNTRITIEEYFRIEQNCELQYPNLNCLIVGSSVKRISLPIEFCRVKGGQVIQKKYNDDQKNKMIRYAATSTNKRKEKIMNLVKEFKLNSSHIIKGFGIKVATDFLYIPMRVLSPPSIEYRNNQTIEVFDGAWRMESNEFLRTNQKQHKWAIIYHRNCPEQINYHNLQTKLVHNLLNASGSVNLALEDKPIIEDFENIGQKLKEIKEKQLDLVVVVIPRKDTDGYAAIKKSAELEIGILTQCIIAKTVLKFNRELALNLLLKINAKLNGTNHRLDANNQMPFKGIMFLGADVTHPSPDQRNIPSVVGVAASHDANGFCYNMQSRLQEVVSRADETIKDMQSIVSQHLAIYYAKNQNTYPDRIIYYRDGVSEGQFQMVHDIELADIRAACKHLNIDVKITCIVAIKRHHTRFFPRKQPRVQARGIDYNNVKPGTVVDRVIVHPNEVQFFMVSHKSIQGTARPTCYNVILDEANMKIDDIQKLTHNLCHLFPRCNRAVSYATPVYLAHLAAARGRVYLGGDKNQSRIDENHRVHPDMTSNPMYFV